MKFDLHVHTTFSDGLLSYEEVIDLAVKKNLKGISITDHDTVEGIEPAIDYSKKLKNFYIIPGIELSAKYKEEEVHILGYFIDYKSSDIMDLTKRLELSRTNRAYKILKKINKLGMTLSINEIKEQVSNNLIGRPHIARALVSKGYVKNVDEAFAKYLEIGKPAYVERFKLNIEETVNFIHKIGGIAVLAHPGLLKDKSIINYSINKGIDGLEVIHSKHTKEDIGSFFKIAQNSNLIITGGSDCHGEKINGKYLLGEYFIDLNYIPIMKGRI